MKLVALLLIACLIHVSLQEAVPFRDKRQIDPQCAFTYGNLNSRERQCINGLYGDTNNPTDPSSFDGQLESLCSNDVCRNAAKKLLVGCRGVFTPFLPTEYQNVDLGAFFDLFCTKSSDKLFCYSHLPLFDDDNIDPLTSCQTVLSGATCNQDCRQALEDYTSTCCFASYLQLLPNNTRVQPTQIWNVCHITPPQLCDGTTTGSQTGSLTNSSSNSGSNNEHSDDSKKNHTGIIAVVCVTVGLLVLVAVVVSITVVIYYKKRTHRWISVNSGDTVRMMSDNNDEI
ncbi:uncharacterized protein [Dysidea avara]|uniref:uncharacterized protein n=1 Tax=Dysidea avara TaxID=196820 RepID=UPI00332E6FE1